MERRVNDSADGTRQMERAKGMGTERRKGRISFVISCK